MQPPFHLFIFSLLHTFISSFHHFIPLFLRSSIHLSMILSFLHYFSPSLFHSVTPSFLSCCIPIQPHVFMFSRFHQFAPSFFFLYFRCLFLLFLRSYVLGFSTLFRSFVLATVFLISGSMSEKRN